MKIENKRRNTEKTEKEKRSSGRVFPQQLAEERTRKETPIHIRAHAHTRALETVHVNTVTAFGHVSGPLLSKEKLLKRSCNVLHLLPVRVGVGVAQNLAREKWWCEVKGPDNADCACARLIPAGCGGNIQLP